MLNKELTYEKNKLSIHFKMSQEHATTMFIIKANGGSVEFEQRSEKKLDDIDKNNISWKVCDDLVEMGLLREDEEAFNVHFDISELGEKFLLIK